MNEITRELILDRIDGSKRQAVECPADEAYHLAQIEILKLALEALKKREEKTTVRKAWRIVYPDGLLGGDYYTKIGAERATPPSARVLPITITETEGH